MRKLAYFACAALLGLGVAGQTFAQDATETAPQVQPRVNQIERRMERQENRIESGVESGKLTTEEAAKREQKLERVENRFEAAQEKNDGHLTKPQQRRLNKSLNTNSRKIYRQKHNAVRAK